MQKEINCSDTLKNDSNGPQESDKNSKGMVKMKQLDVEVSTPANDSQDSNQPRLAHTLATCRLAPSNYVYQHTEFSDPKSNGF